MISQPVSIGHYLFHYGNEDLLNHCRTAAVGCAKDGGKPSGEPRDGQRPVPWRAQKISIQPWWVRSHYGNSNGKSDEIVMILHWLQILMMLLGECHFQTHRFGRWISSRASLLPLVYGLEICCSRMSGWSCEDLATPELLADWWGNQWPQDTTGICCNYPLVNVYITMENHHF